MEFNEAESLLDLVKVYQERYEEEIEKLPFHYNVLEEVRVNENAHTRLLIRLLKHPQAVKHLVLWLSAKLNFRFPVEQVNTPILTAEKHRIDGLIQERGRYVIIIENKVCGAEEQGQQLKRYIDKCLKLGYSLDQIYILYLFSRPGNEPSGQTWGRKRGDKYSPQDFVGRYLVLSYADDIIPWLKDWITELKVTDKKNELLRCGAIQYLDYLNLQFNSNRYTEMNKKLKDLIAEKLELSELSVRNSIDLLKDKLDSIELLKSELEELLGNSRIEAWGKEFQQEYSEAKVFFNTDLKIKYPKAGIHFTHECGRFVALIEFSPQTHKVYIGLGCHQGASEKRIPKLQEIFDQKLSVNLRHGSSGKWYRWHYVEPKDAMEKFKELVDELKKSIGAKLEKGDM